jgi:hypothetical protein
LPGGEYSNNNGGSSLDYLNEKIKEELPGITLISKVYYKSFEGTNNKSKLETRVYLAEFQGDEKITGNGISESKWIKAKEVLKYPVLGITREIIASLNQGKYFENKEYQKEGQRHEKKQKLSRGKNKVYNPALSVKI